jgi:glycosyltransferase involved in cell wall biosynthesis
MKKIVYIGNRLSKKGKTITAIETLGNLLKKEGFDVVLASSRVNKISRLLDMIFTVIVNRKDTNFVLIDTYSTLNFYYAILLALLCRIMSIAYIPILRGGDLPNRIQKSKRNSRVLFGNSFANVAPSEYLLDAFRLAGFENTIHIPNNIEIEKYPFKKRVILQPNLLWVRSFRTIYNPVMAIEVLAMLKNKYPNATLCMIGPNDDPSFEITQHKVKALGMQNSITFTGMLPKKLWHKKAEAYDVFINTTDFDNTPVSVMEAMALGLPVVSTNVGGIPYLLSDYNEALLVEKNDPKAMFEAIDKLMNSSSLVQKISTNAREKVCSFDWEIVKKQWIELFNH